MSIENQLKDSYIPSNSAVFEVPSGELAVVDPYYALFGGSRSQEQIEEILSRFKIQTTLKNPCVALPNGAFIWLQTDTLLNVYRTQNGVTIVDESEDQDVNPLMQVPIDSASVLIGDRRYLGIERFHMYLPQAVFAVNVENGLYQCSIIPLEDRIAGKIILSKS